MAKMQYFDGNGGFWAVDDFSGYTVGALANGKRILTYDGDVDPTQYPYQITLTYSGLKTATAQTGVFAGQSIAVEGTVTSITYHNAQGRKIAELTGLKGVDAALFDIYVRLGEGYQAFQLAVAGGVTVTGSANSSIPANDWNGDDITTGGGNDVVNAGGGDDFIKDGGGKDTYNGGAGWDVVSYDQSFWNAGRGGRGIEADLAKGTVRGTDGIVDKLSSVESLRGSYLNDVIKGDKKDNWFIGLAGRDTIDGGAGRDGVGFHKDHEASRGGGTRGIEVELRDGTAKGFAIDGWGTRDVLISIEDVEGSRLNDKITGNASKNWIGGRDGNDTLSGAGGNDDLQGDAGADSLSGGAGNDQLDGGEGDDHLTGGAGNDRFICGPGNDVMTGGDGADRFVFNEAPQGYNAITDFILGTDSLVLSGTTGATIGNRVSVGNFEGKAMILFDDAEGNVVLQNVAYNANQNVADFFAFE